MTLTDQHIISFQDLYRTEFGEEISRQDAQAQALGLIRLVLISYEMEPNNTENNTQENYERN